MPTDPFSKDSLKEIRRGAAPADWVALAIVGIALLVRVPAALGHELAHTGFLTFLGLIAAAYLLVRLIIIARRTLLWRLRNRLIVAYIFIAVVPILLLFIMFGFAGYLLELQIGAHLLRDDLKQRENMIAADAAAIAGVVGREPDLKPAPAAPPLAGGRGGRGRERGRGERPPLANSQPTVPEVLTPDQLENMKILSRPSVAGVIAAAQTDWPDLNVQLNLGSELVRNKASGAFAGLIELRGQLFFASVQTLPVAGGRNTVLVAAPVTPALLDALPSKLGPIQLELLTPVLGSRGTGPPSAGRVQNPPPAGQAAPPSARQASPQNTPPNGQPPSVAGQPPFARGDNGFRAPNGRGQGPRQSFSIHGTNYYIGQRIASTKRTVAPRQFWGDMQVGGLATFDALRVQRGNSGADLPVQVTYAFRLSTVNGDLLTSLGDYAPLVTELLLAAFIVFLVLELFALVTGIILTRTITHSVADLYGATLRIRGGDLAHRIRIERQDQLGALAESFNEMTGSVSELINEQKQRQRLENEVSIAREVQRQLFPKKLPSIPGLELAAICRPARAVSGDYYDIIPLGGSRVGIALADISGKGIFASLLMASLQAALRSAASLNGNLDTAHIVERLNQHLFQTTSDDRYATLFYAVYDTETRILNYTNAGHLPPLLVTDGRVQTLAEGGTVIGLIEDATYNQGSVEVVPGSVLLVFSDGLTEPENVFGEEFGVERLRDELLRERNAPANKLAEDLIESAERWSGSAEQADDMTVVIARMG